MPGCCGYARCLRVHAETRRRTATIGIDTARWPHHLASSATKVGRGDAVTAVIYERAPLVSKETTYESLESRSRNDVSTKVLRMPQPTGRSLTYSMRTSQHGRCCD